MILPPSPHKDALSSNHDVPTAGHLGEHNMPQCAPLQNILIGQPWQMIAVDILQVSSILLFFPAIGYLVFEVSKSKVQITFDGFLIKWYY